MMRPPASPAAEKPGDDVGPDRADVPDEIAKDFIMAPSLQRLLDAERIAKVDGAREVLLGPVESVYRQQFLSTQDGQGLPELGADLVLAAVTAGGGHEHCPHPLPMTEHREQRIVLVVWVRRRFHERRHRSELANRQTKRRLVEMFPDGLHPQLGGQPDDLEEEDGE